MSNQVSSNCSEEAVGQTEQPTISPEQATSHTQQTTAAHEGADTVERPAEVSGFSASPMGAGNVQSTSTCHSNKAKPSEAEVIDLTGIETSDEAASDEATPLRQKAQRSAKRRDDQAVTLTSCRLRARVEPDKRAYEYVWHRHRSGWFRVGDSSEPFPESWGATGTDVQVQRNRSGIPVWLCYNYHLHAWVRRPRDGDELRLEYLQVKGMICGNRSASMDLGEECQGIVPKTLMNREPR